MKLISIIITTHNRFDYLSQAIDSINKQSYKNIEIIVVDDCSTSARYEELRENKNIRYIRNEINLGASESRKRGGAIAKGDYYIFMDDDDFYTDYNFFDKCITVFENNEQLKLAFVTANANLFIEGEKISGNKLDFIGYVDRLEYLKGFQYKYKKPYSTFTTMFDSSVILKGVLPITKMFNDSSIYIKSLLFGNAWFLEDIVGLYRIHADNISKNLNLSFLIENLEEKYDAFKRIDKLMNFNAEYWLFNQYKLTCDYFMRESVSTMKCNIELLKWVMRHFNKFKYKILFSYFWLINIAYEFKNYFKRREMIM